ncbi:hypothetical protein GDO86_006831 [Hymenochirus boettgeri]|uniref:C2H2 AKAP95-type domain-containing protein n=1 Tax=Hymenochirus boettgeri TaxID=247094 RepID=A0A8T2JC28_9PIPI|nr:hypothetical protein GDO86_006831 [Hymenochirus boettgeri]
MGPTGIESSNMRRGDFFGGNGFFYQPEFGFSGFDSDPKFSGNPNWPPGGGNHQGPQIQGNPSIEWRGDKAENMNSAPWQGKRKRKRKKKHLQVPVDKTPMEGGKGATVESRANQSNPTAETTPQNGSSTKIDGDEPKTKKIKMNQDKDHKTASLAPVVQMDQEETPCCSTAFTCCLCCFTTEDEKEIEKHFRNCIHTDILRQLYKTLPKNSVDFIQDYLKNDVKKVASERQKLNMNLKQRDCFKDIGQEHYIHRVEAAHCVACDMLVPDVPDALKDHITSESHSKNRRALNNKMKNTCVKRADSFLSSKNIAPLLKAYNQENSQLQHKELKGAQGDVEAAKNAPEQDSLLEDPHDEMGSQAGEAASLQNEETTPCEVEPSDLEVCTAECSDEETEEAP